MLRRRAFGSFIYLLVFVRVGRARAYTYIRTLRIYIYTYSRPRQIANAAQPLAAYNIVENLIFKLHMHYYRVHSALCSVFNLERLIIRLTIVIIIILNIDARAECHQLVGRYETRAFRFRRDLQVVHPTKSYPRGVNNRRCSAYYNYYILYYCCCCCYY